MPVDELIEYWKREKIITDKNVIAAFKAIKREIFVLHNMKEESYLDIPLPIGYGQTISQPTTIAIMTQALELRKGIRVLEIGAGSGYQAALIGYIVGIKGKVFTAEIVPQLADFARKNLKKAGIKNVTVLNIDGSNGYAKEMPYDRIIFTAATPETPKHLLLQLKKGGILLAPVGPLYNQQLLKIKKRDAAGKKIDIENLGDFIFVPLRGEKGVWD